MDQRSSTVRFSNRVENYRRYRPGYPAAVLGVLRDEIGLAPTWRIADVGSGTGISAELLLKNGNEVFAVEPNGPMRTAAERLLEQYAAFHSIDGTAEATTLPEASVEAVVAAQAFHWFDPRAFGEECRRMLVPDGWAVLLWNARRLASTPFLRDYESLIKKYGSDYSEVRHENVDAKRLELFFGNDRWQKRLVDNEQRLTRDGLHGRTLSSSYIPGDDDPAQAELLSELDELFAREQREGCVVIQYDVEIYFGRLTSPAAKSL
jgi:SAM-dependent methyltransferase